MKRDRPKHTLYVIAYDIPSDRRRTKVHKTLCGFGQWTQYSLFECHLTDKELVALRGRDDWIGETGRGAGVHRLIDRTIQRRARFFDARAVCERRSTSLKPRGRSREISGE